MPPAASHLVSFFLCDSRLNRQEAALAAKRVRELLAAGVPAGGVAVITPYAAQVRLLRELLRGAGVEIDSVDGFQGREKEAVVISFVRSNPEGEIGFLADVRRTNVALTRARRALVVIGDSATLSHHEFYQRLLGYFEDEKLAFVQTPHAFYNFDSFQARLNHRARKYWEEGQLFYHVIQPGRNRTGCPIFAGSAAMFRRSALKEVGYIATETITEDMHTGLRMHSRGWKSLGTRRSISTSVGASRGSGASGMSALKPLPSAGRFSMCSLRSVTRRTTSRITPPNGRGLHARAPGTLRRRAIGCRRG